MPIIRMFLVHVFSRVLLGALFGMLFFGGFGAFLYVSTSHSIVEEDIIFFVVEYALSGVVMGAVMGGLAIILIAAFQLLILIWKHPRRVYKNVTEFLYYWPPHLPPKKANHDDDSGH